MKKILIIMMFLFSTTAFADDKVGDNSFYIAPGMTGGPAIVGGFRRHFDENDAIVVEGILAEYSGVDLMLAHDIPHGHIMYGVGLREWHPAITIGVDQNIEGIKFMFRMSYFELPVFSTTTYTEDEYSVYSRCDSREWFRGHCKGVVITPSSSYTETTRSNHARNEIFIGIQIEL